VAVYEGKLERLEEKYYPDGSQCYKQWLNDKRHDLGSYTNGYYMHTGKWESDLEHGEGTVTDDGILMMTGRCTSGSWKEGLEFTCRMTSCWMEATGVKTSKLDRECFVL
jgi:hypothetical protein